MSYARFGWDNSDVYVFLSVGGWVECCSCRFRDDMSSEHCSTADEMIEHLRAHEAAGHVVPPETYDELAEDRQLIADFIADEKAGSGS